MCEIIISLCLSHQGIYSLWIKSQFFSFFLLVNGLSKHRRFFSTWKSSYNKSGNHFGIFFWGKAETIMQIAWLLWRPLNTSYTYNGVDDDIPTKDILFSHIFSRNFYHSSSSSSYIFIFISFFCCWNFYETLQISLYE